MEKNEEKKKRTPRTPELITKGALELPLGERVAIVKALQASIDNEVKELKEAAQKAESLAAALAGSAVRSV